MVESPFPRKYHLCRCSGTVSLIMKVGQQRRLDSTTLFGSNTRINHGNAKPLILDVTDDSDFVSVIDKHIIDPPFWSRYLWEWWRGRIVRVRLYVDASELGHSSFAW